MSQLFGNLLDESKELNDAIEKVVNLASGFGKSIQKSSQADLRSWSLEKSKWRAGRK